MTRLIALGLVVSALTACQASVGYPSVYRLSQHQMAVTCSDGWRAVAHQTTDITIIVQCVHP